MLLYIADTTDATIIDLTGRDVNDVFNYGVHYFTSLTNRIVTPVAMFVLAFSSYISYGTANYTYHFRIVYVHFDFYIVHKYYLNLVLTATYF